MPAPPYSGGKIVPSRPSLPSSLIVASGNSQASSQRMTFGAISRSANSRTVFFNCSCSSFNWKSKDTLLDYVTTDGVTTDALRRYQLQIPRSARDDKQKWVCGSRLTGPIGMPRAGTAQNLASKFSFKHGQHQSRNCRTDRLVTRHVPGESSHHQT